MDSAALVRPLVDRRSGKALIARAARVLVGLVLLAAVVLKLAAPNESAATLATSIADAYGIEAPPFTLLGGAVALDLLLALLVLLPRLRPALSGVVAFFGITFLAHHVVIGGADCGCFGVHPWIPSWSPWVLAALVSVIGAIGVLTAAEARPRPRELVFALAALLLPAALAAPLGAVLPGLARRTSGPVVSERIEARNALLFVFSPSCPSCEGEARELLARNRKLPVVGIATPELGDVDAFFRRVGASFPVEFVSRERWFGLIDRAPPAYYLVSADGELQRIGRDAALR